jgi:hypothetical protein
VAVSPGIYNARGDRAGLAIEERRASTPVTRGSRPSAAGSIGDLVKDIISEQNFTIEQLQRYISGEQG